MLKKIWDRRKAELLFELQSELKVLPCTHEHIHACAYTHGCRRARTLARPPAPTHARTQTRTHARARTHRAMRRVLAQLCLSSRRRARRCMLQHPITHVVHATSSASWSTLLHVAHYLVHHSHVATSCDVAASCNTACCNILRLHAATLHVATSCNTACCSILQPHVATEWFLVTWAMPQQKVCMFARCSSHMTNMACHILQKKKATSISPERIREAARYVIAQNPLGNVMLHHGVA